LPPLSPGKKEGKRPRHPPRQGEKTAKASTAAYEEKEGKKKKKRRGKKREFIGVIGERWRI